MAERTTLEAGESTTLRWQTENAATVEITGLGNVSAEARITTSDLEIGVRRLFASGWK
jgi:hypothetical protein